VAAEVGVSLSREDYFERFLGLPDRECLAAVCVRTGRVPSAAELDQLVARKRRRYAELARDATLHAGVADALRRLHPHFVLAIASGAFRDEIEPLLQRAQVRDLFSAVVGAEDVQAGKPAPDPFLRALREINRVNGGHLTAADCVVVEDSPNGITAAHAAGMRCVAVTTSHHAAELAAADAIVAHVSRLRPEDLQ
jgi:HAD superfamily hydrolase (TIGR01509 family)